MAHSSFTERHDDKQLIQNHKTILRLYFEKSLKELGPNNNEYKGFKDAIIGNAIDKEALIAGYREGKSNNPYIMGIEEIWRVIRIKVLGDDVNDLALEMFESACNPQPAYNSVPDFNSALLEAQKDL